jgi:formiminotetrahydrofolate cyclodeaminase
MLSRRRVDELLRALGERTPTPASGAATALTAAMAAALAELAARFAGDEDAAGRAHSLADELVRLGDEDGAAYSAFMAERTPAARRRIIAVP